jgi:hypothetical protein
MKTRRLLLLVGGGVLLVAAALLYLYFRYSKPVGSGPAGPQVPREAFAKPWTTRKVLLVGLGDSVTAGFGVDPQHSYFGRLVKNPDDEFLGHGIHCTQPWQVHYRRHDPHYWYAWNLEDPNIRGYDAIRRLFLIEIAKHVGQLKAL